MLLKSLPTIPSTLFVDCHLGLATKRPVIMPTRKPGTEIKQRVGKSMFITGSWVQW